jgi:hypothetical protein
MLALQDYVHLSFKLQTPLLCDKLNKGYPHAVLAFDAGALARLPGHALLPHNTKAWSSRQAYRPATDPIEKARLLKRHLLFRELQSLEFLVKYAIGLDSGLASLRFVSPHEEEWVKSLCDSAKLRLPPVVHVDESLAPPGYRPVSHRLIEEYFGVCRRTRSVPTPPADIPFD